MNCTEAYLPLSELSRKPAFLGLPENPSGSAIAPCNAARFSLRSSLNKVLHLEVVSAQRGNRFVSSRFLLLQSADK